ncbi:macrolide transporter subunit MacA [Thalassospira marina]|uniref:Macrolide transporter subunit MacA n=1 Tax=Thalassospira marina TaxID=2048283 RepID=A0A2N3KR67_9PROT|nr:macrolide transporter subunit MacA [Thalassospira marina]PKR53047.1 macrolide transporter subunit MacA [Thalassospira marina]
MKKLFARRTTIIIVLLLLAAGGWLGRNYFFPPETAPNYVTATVSRGDLESTVLASGALEASQLVSVGAQVSGQIQKLFVALGDVIKKGDLIAEIDPSTQQNALSDAKAKLANIEAQLASKKATLRQAQQAFDRQKKMRRLDATPQEDLETAEATLAVTKAEINALNAQIDQARIAVDTAQIDLDYTQIRAPMDGTVVSLPVKVGQTVNAVQSTPTIIKLAQLATMTVKAEISEADVIRVKPSQKVYFTILGDPDSRYHAALRAIEPAPDEIDDNDDGLADNEAVYYNALFDVPNPDGILRIAMTTEVTIVLKSVKGALIIPSSALMSDADDKYYVQIPDAKGAITKQPVTVGLNTNVKAEITSGLKEGDTVIIGAASDAALASASGGRRPRGMMF